ncbi:hypothetical protein LHV13_02915 [Ferrovum sp. PN-J185]|uniref:hypothetical protein n=1 Tax=Ferrovum sp. PN-J185 TaxID=1356306 RepID=UPI00079CC72F|nr:hypothetical protein [Ferrovum sp. PN-J185]KXW56525.1 hypothetical protein FV185_04750 [Ferrovum sp. PN-J185]MCC6068126.1 hypothetical protein [Ferrovum sp. PN-J185]MDE1891762.1 hypothetical protein [Betaproteobacteria bacterium]MDE2056396.1 hypothetical protein [Betaproteobacteria bacterium]
MTVNQRRGLYGVIVGFIINLVCDLVLGVNVEVYKGIATFNVLWMIDVFFVPFGVGYVTSRIYGEKGGRYVACLPPLLLRPLSYLYLHYIAHPMGDFFLQLNLYYWGPMLILVVESANFGGIIGEVMAGVLGKKPQKKTELSA